MTAQIHEIVIYEGEQMALASDPGIPEDHPKIVLDTEFNQDSTEGLTMVINPAPGVAATTVAGQTKDPKYPSILNSTACWRQYIGTWEIKDGKLYLVDIIGKYKKIGDEPIFADWFTGRLKIPMGEIV